MSTKQEPPRPATPPPTIKTYTFPPSNPQLAPLTVSLIGSHHSLWGHILFESSLVMSNHLFHNQSRLVSGKNVVEFGAGAGVPGLAAGVLGARKVVLTDYPSVELLKNLEENVKENSAVHEGLDGRVVVEGHVWGRDCAPVLKHLQETEGSQSDLATSTTSSSSTIPNPDPSQQPSTSLPPDTLPDSSKFQTLLLSDLIFNHSQHLALLRSLERLIDPACGTALVFHSHHLPQHRARDLKFFELAEKRGWTVESVVEEVRGVQFVDDGGDVGLRERVWGREMRWDGVIREEGSDSENEAEDKK
jgi:nicotinamide N-methyltransferase